MQPSRSDSSDENVDAPVTNPAASDAPPPVPGNDGKPSLWSKAKGAIGDVSGHASRIAAVGTASVAKTTEIGKQSFGAVADATRGVVETGKSAYARSTLAAAIDRLDEQLDKTGAKKLIADSAGAAVEKLDQVTGKRLVELLEEKLRAQDLYNNVLATRLAEALERIARLEAKLNDD